MSILAQKQVHLPCQQSSRLRPVPSLQSLQGASARHYRCQQRPLRASGIAVSKPAAASCRATRSSDAELAVSHSHHSDALHIKQSCPAVSLSDPQSEGGTVPSWLQFGMRCAKGAIVFAIAVALALAPLSGSAWAARSSGRMGGSSFGAARSGSSYGGAGLSSGGMGIGRGYMGSPTYGGGRSYPSYSSPSLTVIPQPRLAFGFGGFYDTPFTGGGYSAPVVQSSGGFGGGGLIAILGLGLLAFVLFQAFGDNLEDEPGSGNGTVVKLSVALTGSARSLQHEMERIAKRADTNDPEGLHYVLQETVLSLLRHPEYCEYATSSKKNVRGLEEAEETFNEASMEERSKYKEESLSNVGGRTKNSAGNGKWASSSGRGPGDDLIVVTILVATDGAVNVQKVNNNETLRAALNKLGGIRSEQVLAVEVIWTPQDDGDYYSRDEMMMEFPQMSTL